MHKRKQVVFLPRWYPNRIDNLSGIFVKRHAEAVTAQADVTVIFPIADSIKNLYEVIDKKENNVREIILYYKKETIGIPFLDKIIRTILYFYLLFKAYNKIVKENGKPDINHVHILLKPGLFAFFQKLTTGVPYVITEHWSGYLPENIHYKGFIRKFLTKVVCRKALGISVVSSALQKAMKAHGLGGNIQIIRNVVDTSIFQPNNTLKQEKRKKILHVSEFVEEAKNIKGILRAVKKLSEKRTDFFLTIVGYGKDEKELKEFSGNLNLTGNFVFFEGKKRGQQLANEFSSSAFFVLFSHYENNPCVLIESFASGLPVIATKAGGIPEIVNKFNGILVPAGNEEALVKEMDFLLDNYDNYSKKIISGRAKEEYSYESIGKKFIALYKFPDV